MHAGQLDRITPARESENRLSVVFELCSRHRAQNSDLDCTISPIENWRTKPHRFPLKQRSYRLVIGQESAPPVPARFPIRRRAGSSVTPLCFKFQDLSQGSGHIQVVIPPLPPPKFETEGGDNYHFRDFPEHRSKNFRLRRAKSAYLPLYKDLKPQIFSRLRRAKSIRFPLCRGP